MKNLFSLEAGKDKGRQKWILQPSMSSALIDKGLHAERTAAAAASVQGEGEADFFFFFDLPLFFPVLIYF